MLGILGGTFDPIHHGHLRTALDVAEALGLDEVRLIPLRHAVHRDQPETPAALRLAMVQAAIASEPHFVADDREIRRDGPSYTLHTLESLRGERGAAEPICVLVGSDAFAEFLTWHRPHDILGLAHLIVMRRPGEPTTEDPALRTLVERHRAADAGELRARPGGRILFQTVTQLAISATDIRARLHAGRSVRYLLPEAVLDVIQREELYAPLTGGSGAMRYDSDVDLFHLEP
jgi:nicotinate-nucleotide adenylyltransferase